VVTEQQRMAKRKRDRDRRNAARRADPHTKEYTKILRKDPCCIPGCKNPAETIDHVVPFSKGGKTHWSNLTGMCRTHNQKKAKKSLLHFLLGV
jgi:5-methylcytosine-specific restriction endonuclease McrA